MYIVRWLMGRPIIAVLVLAAIAVLLNFGQADKTSETAIHKPTTVQDDSAQPEQLQPQIEEASTNSLEFNQSIEGNVASKATKNINLTGNVVSGESIVPANKVTPKLSETNTEINVSEAPDSSSAEISDLGQLSTEEMLLMAREAYWNNGLDEAAQIYKQLIKLNPKTAEYRGELGNVYWRQGFPKKAAELYSQIALPMIEQGDSERVANMIGFIGLFYPDRAAKIHKRLQSKSDNNK